jgi:hypothetical protein
MGTRPDNKKGVGGMKYTCWAGYLPDHTFESDECLLTYEEARSGVLDALADEARHARHEGMDNEDEMYTVAAAILEASQRGAIFDVTIRDERFAVVPSEVCSACYGVDTVRRLELPQPDDHGGIETVIRLQCSYCGVDDDSTGRKGLIHYEG